MSDEYLHAVLALLMHRLPPFPRSDLNDRTLWVWRRHWLDKLSVAEIAAERGWSKPAVEWHLRRAKRALE